MIIFMNLFKMYVFLINIMEINNLEYMSWKLYVC